MQVHKARPGVQLWHRQLGRGIDKPYLQPGFDKPIIEIGGDKPNTVFIPR